MHSVDNEIVRELNEWLEDFTRENKIRLIDINKEFSEDYHLKYEYTSCLLYTSPSPRDKRQSRMPSSA